VVDTVSSLVTKDTELALVIVLAVVVGGVLLARDDRRMGRVWCACFVVPLTLATVAGLVAPVLLDRTLTMVAWAPMLAIAVVLDRLLRRAPALGVAAVVVAGLLLLPPSFSALEGSTGADRALRRLEAVARPGDVVAVRAAGKAPEVQWTLGVRGHQPWHPVTLTDVLPTVAGLRIGGAAPTGRIWVLDWNSRVRAAPGYQRCAPDRHFGVSRILCLRRVDTR
jgi:hypothetical protein